MDILGFLNDNDDAYAALHICYFSIATIKRRSRLGVRLGPLSYLYVCGRHQTSPPPCPVKGKRSCRVQLGRNAIVYKQLQEKKTMCTSRTQNVRTIRSMCSFVTHRLEEKDKSIAKRIKDNECRGYHTSRPSRATYGKRSLTRKFFAGCSIFAYITFLYCSVWMHCTLVCALATKAANGVEYLLE